MDLSEARIGHGSALLVGLPCSRHIGSHGVGGQEKDIPITTGAQKHGVGTVAFQFSGDQVAGDYTSRLSVDHHEVHHLVPRIHLHLSLGDLSFQCGIRAEKQLLTGLSFCVKSAAHLNATERTVVEQTSIIAGKGNALGHTLVDDAGRDLRQAVHIGFPGTVVTAFDRIVEQPVGGVSVVLIILCGIDAALSRDRMRSSGRVLKAEGLHIVAHFTERGGGGCAGEARSHDDHIDVSFVGWVHQADVRFVLRPLLVDRSFWDLGV